MSDYPAGAKGGIEYSKDLMAFSKAEDEAYQVAKTDRRKKLKRLPIPLNKKKLKRMLEHVLLEHKNLTIRMVNALLKMS